MSETEIHKNFLIEGLQGKFTEQQINDYVEESEHLEGNDYWFLFETPADLESDIKLYLAGLYENVQ